MAGLCAAVIGVGLSWAFSSQLPLLHTARTALSNRRQQTEPLVLGWVPYWDQAAALTSLETEADRIDFAGIFWYTVRADGSIDTYPYAEVSRSVVKNIQAQGVGTLAVIANLPPEDEGGDWDDTRLDKALGTPIARRRHIAEIVALVQAMGFDGVNIDYEALRPDQRDEFSAFIKELSSTLHAEGKIVGVSLLPKTTDVDPDFENGSAAQDWAALSQHADHLYLMTYEEHWEDSEPGSVASLPWMKEVLLYARSQSPASKLFGCLLMYVYDCAAGRKAEGLTYTQVRNLVASHQLQPRWDATAGSWYFSYADQDGTHHVWYEDATSVQEKVDLLQSLGITHVAVWRLGNEDPAAWSAL